MESAWIKVFVLTLTQCIAPAGKMICQEETVEYQFANEEDCARALVQMIDLASRADNILVDRQNSDCRPAVRESTVFASNDAAISSLGKTANAVVIEDKETPADFLQAAHDERLKNMQTCEETKGVAPCRIGDIIMEPAADSVRSEVWQQEN
ncbi:MAG: hypothetical protein ACR2Q3_03105 [Woeseiaceae bacterium]